MYSLVALRWAWVQTSGQEVMRVGCGLQEGFRGVERRPLAGPRLKDDPLCTTTRRNCSCGCITLPLAGRHAQAEYTVVGVASGPLADGLECPRAER